MNRRRLFKLLAGLPFVPKAVEAANPEPLDLEFQVTPTPIRGYIDEHGVFHRISTVGDWRCVNPHYQDPK